MSAMFRIRVYKGDGQYYADDSAPTEEEIRQQASGWTGQRGQMTWRAEVFRPDGTPLATYRRGVEVTT